MAHAVNFRAGLFRSNPTPVLAGVLAFVFSGLRHRQLTVKRHCRLQRHEWLLRSNPARERLVEVARLFFADPPENIDARRPKALQPDCIIHWVRIHPPPAHSIRAPTIAPSPPT